MSLALTDEQLMIQEAARDYLSQASDSAAVRVAVESSLGFDPDVWRCIASELGWCALPIAEDCGGLGLGPVELVLIQEQAGKQLLCAPFFSTVCLGTTILQAVGTPAARELYLPNIAAGELTLGVALPQAGVQWQAGEVRAEANGDGWLLSGRVRVVDGASADQLLIAAELAGTSAWFMVSPDAVQIKALETWDGTRRFAEVILEQVAVATRCDEPEADAARGLALARLYIAAEQLGAAQACLDLTTAFVAERKQFGRAIGSFQAVKHRCAQMMVAIEAARSTIYGAAAQAAGQCDTADLQLDCAAARALASDALFYSASEAIQLHGGVGFTWEYDPQLYFKRAQASSHWLGDASAMRGLIAQQFMGNA